MQYLKRESINAIDLLPVLKAKRKEEAEFANAFRGEKKHPIFKENESSKYKPKNIIGNLLYSSDYSKP